MSIEEIICKYGKDILRFCRFTAGERDNGDDLYQDTMLYLMNHLDSFDTSENSVKSLAMSIAVFLWKSKKRKYARRMSIVPMESIDALEERNDGAQDIPVIQDTPEELLIRKEEVEFLRLSIIKLPEKYRLPLLLHYLSEMQIKEIGEVLKLPESTVKTRLKRAKDLLRKEMEKYEG